MQYQLPDYSIHTFTGAIDVIVLKVETVKPKRLSDVRRRLLNRGMNYFPIPISMDEKRIDDEALTKQFLLHIHKPQTITDIHTAVDALGKNTMIIGRKYLEFAVDVRLKDFNHLDDDAYRRHLATVTWQRFAGLKTHNKNIRAYKYRGRKPTTLSNGISTPEFALFAEYQFAMGSKGVDQVFTHAYVKTYDTIHKRKLPKSEWRSRVEIGIIDDELSNLIAEDGSFRFERAARHFNVNTIDPEVISIMKMAIAENAVRLGALIQELAPSRPTGKKADEQHNKKTRNALGNLRRDFNREIRFKSK